MSVPSISVIIPAFNYGSYLAAALHSISAQSFTDWECIIVDDGSTDDTRLVAEKHIQGHPAQQFRYVYIANSGTSVAKNTGIDLARGKYIQFLDADDLLSKDKLAIQFALIESRDCALVFSGSVFFKDGQEQQEFTGHYPKGFLAEASLEHAALLRAMIRNNVMTISSPLVHKALLLQAGKFQLDLKNNEDWLLWFRVALLKPIFIFDGNERSRSKIRIHPNSAMRAQHNMYLGEVVVRHAMDTALQDLNTDIDTSALRRLNMDLLALHRIRSLDWAKGWRHIIQAMLENPFRAAPLFAEGLFKSSVRIYRKLTSPHGS